MLTLTLYKLSSLPMLSHFALYVLQYTSVYYVWKHLMLYCLWAVNMSALLYIVSSVYVVHIITETLNRSKP